MAKYVEDPFKLITRIYDDRIVAKGGNSLFSLRRVVQPNRHPWGRYSRAIVL